MDEDKVMRITIRDDGENAQVEINLNREMSVRDYMLAVCALIKDVVEGTEIAAEPIISDIGDYFRIGEKQAEVIYEN